MLCGGGAFSARALIGQAWFLRLGRAAAAVAIGASCLGQGRQELFARSEFRPPHLKRQRMPTVQRLPPTARQKGTKGDQKGTEKGRDETLHQKRSDQARDQDGPDRRDNQTTWTGQPGQPWPKPHQTSLPRGRRLHCTTDTGIGDFLFPRGPGRHRHRLRHGCNLEHTASCSGARPGQTRPRTNQPTATAKTRQLKAKQISPRLASLSRGPGRHARHAMNMLTNGEPQAPPPAHTRIKHYTRCRTARIRLSLHPAKFYVFASTRLRHRPAWPRHVARTGHVTGFPACIEKFGPWMLIAFGHVPPCSVALRGTPPSKGARVPSGHGCARVNESPAFWVKALRKMAALPNPPSRYLQ